MIRPLNGEDCVCGCHKPQKEDWDITGTIGELVRDFAKVGSIPKSEGRRRIEELLSYVHRKARQATIQEDIEVLEGESVDVGMVKNIRVVPFNRAIEKLKAKLK